MWICGRSDSRPEEVPVSTLSVSLLTQKTAVGFSNDMLSLPDGTLLPSCCPRAPGSSAPQLGPPLPLHSPPALVALVQGAPLTPALVGGVEWFPEKLAKLPPTDGGLPDKICDTQLNLNYKEVNFFSISISHVIFILKKKKRWFVGNS